MTLTERLNIIATNTEPLNKHVIWLKNNMLYRWAEYGWKPIGGASNQSGTTDYNELINKPSINSITLKGDVKLNLEGYTKDEIDNKFNNLSIPNIDLTEYAKKSEIPSIEGLASETFVTTKIAEAQLGGGEIDLSDYATKLELQEAIKSIPIPSLNGYATELWVNAQGFIKDIPDDYAKKDDIPSLSGYATETFVTQKINEAQLGGGENGEDIDLSIYVTEEELRNKGYATIAELNNKVDIVDGKQLSAEDFTTALKTKLEGLNNYDDTELSNAIETLRGDFDTIVSGDTTTAIKTFNEVIAFLDGLTDTQDLESIIASIEQQIAGKMDKVTLAKVATSGSYSDLSDKPTIPDTITESTVSGWGFTKNEGTYSKPSDGIPKNDLASEVQESLGKADTALQSYTEQYRGTVTGVRVNNSTKNSVSGIVDIGNVVTGVKINNSTKNPSNGIVDLGTVITSHQDISGKQDTLIPGVNIKTINGEDILGEGNIEIETTVDGDFATTEDYGSEVLMPLSSIVSMTQEEYDSLASKNPNTIYLIVS